MEVGKIVDLQVGIDHAIFWILAHSSGTHLMEAVRSLFQDTVTQLFLRVPVLQPPYGIRAQGCIQNLMGTDHAIRIAVGKAKIDCDPREPKLIGLICQDDAAIGVRLLLCMVVESVFSVATADEKTRLAGAPQVSI